MNFAGLQKRAKKTEKMIKADSNVRNVLESR